jgi:hypothetical protein
MTGQVGGDGHTVADVGERAGSHQATTVGDRTADIGPRGRVTALSVREVVAGVRCCVTRPGDRGHRRRAIQDGVDALRAARPGLTHPVLQPSRPQQTASRPPAP